MHIEAFTFCSFAVLFFGFRHTERYPKLYQAVKDVLVDKEILKLDTITSATIVSARILDPEPPKDIATAFWLYCDPDSQYSKSMIAKLSTELEFAVKKQSASNTKTCKAQLMLYLEANRDTYLKEAKATIEDMKFIPEDCKQDVKARNAIGWKSLSKFRKPLEKYYTGKLVSAISASGYYSNRYY